MSKSYRIRTVPGVNTNIKINIDQDFDTLDILSLKMTQTGEYNSLCADFGVVVGRVFTNGGYGIPNARVSIFVPISDVDEDNPVISEIYPFRTSTSKNDEGYRYNLLPSVKQHSGHTPTGTFPSKVDVLTQEHMLEVYDKYYKYTAKTNDSGDFMLFGVPLGTHTIHYDIDLSDIGCQSLVPYDFKYEGVSDEKFENSYTFTSSDNLDSLPQIVSTQKTVNVEPFWGNPELCQIGITRSDFDLKERGVRIEPYAIMMGGTFTDSGKDALRVNCNVDNQMGEKCRLTTFKGDVEAIRFSGHYETKSDGSGEIDMKRPILESVFLDTKVDENGVYFFRVPMNMKYVTTDEFGYLVESKDENIGIPTMGNYRFRISLNEDTGERNRFTGKYLIPNVREYHTNNDTNFVGGKSTIDGKSYAFSTNLDDYPEEALSEIAGMSQDAIENGQVGVPQDYFYQYRYGRVYTASSFINQYWNTGWWERTFKIFVKDRNESFIGIKEIWPAEKDDCSNTNNFFPINDAVRNHRFNFFVLTLISFIDYISKFISLFIKEFVTIFLFYLAGALAGTKVTNRIGAKMFRRAKEFQFNNIMKLRLITYPDCYDCHEDNDPNNDNTTINVDELDPDVLELYTVDENDLPSADYSDIIFEEKYTRVSDDCWIHTIENNTQNDITITDFKDCDGDNLLNPIVVSPGETIELRGQRNSSIGVTQESELIALGFTFPPQPNNVNNPLELTEPQSYNPDNNLYIPSGIIPPPVIDPITDDGGDIFLYERWVVRIHLFEEETLVAPIGLGQEYGILWDRSFNSWVIQDIYGDISEVLSEVYNREVDEPINGTCHEDSGQVKVAYLWKIDEIEPEDVVITEIEDGCSKYDYIIEDEPGSSSFFGGDMKLRPFVDGFTIYGTNQVLETYAEALEYLESNRPSESLSLPWLTNGQVPSGEAIWEQLDTTEEYTENILGENESECEPRPPYNVLAVSSKHRKIGRSDTRSFRNDVIHCIYNGRYYGKVKKRGPYHVDAKATKNGTISGYSEFRDGVYTLVPLAGRTGELLNNYRRRKLFGKLMCGGVVSYTFSNSWLNGALYFFQFMKRGKNRYCKDCLYRKEDETGVHYYYRSTPFNPNYSEGENQYDYSNDGTKLGLNSQLTEEYMNKTKGFYGSSRDGKHREINYPTTVMDLGPRNTWLNEICSDNELDPNCSVTRSVGATSYKGVDDLMEYVIQSKEIKERGRLDVRDLFDSRKGRLDGDVSQLLNFNTQTGIYPFEIEEDDSPYMDLYNGIFDSKGPIGIRMFYSEDDPDTPELEQLGGLIRSCLNEPGKLGDTSQRVPYFLWNTRGHGFGERRLEGDDYSGLFEDDALPFQVEGIFQPRQGEKQSYYENKVYNQRIQMFKANLNEDLNNDPSDNEYLKPYLLPPIIDCIEVDGEKLKANDNYKEYTVSQKQAHLMEIGVPFHFQLGLRKGSTSYDKFIENYGPK